MYLNNTAAIFYIFNHPAAIWEYAILLPIFFTCLCKQSHSSLNLNHSYYIHENTTIEYVD